MSNLKIAEVAEIFTIDAGVKLFHVTYDLNLKKNVVRNVNENTSLHLFTETQEPSPRIALIKCYDAYFGLSYGKTVVFKCGPQGTYLFPDDKDPNAYNVVVISGASAEVLDLFDGLLEYYSLLTEEPSWIKALPDDLSPALEQATVTPSAPPAEASAAVVPGTSSGRLYPQLDKQPSTEEDIRLPDSRAEIISQRLVEGAELINTGIEYGSDFASRQIKQRAEQYRNRRDITMTEAQVDPNVLMGLRGLRVATSTAATLTGHAASLVSRGTTYAGNLLAPHIRHHGTRLVSKVSGKDYENSSKVMDNVLTVAAGGLHGFGLLYNGIASSVTSLAKTASDETVKVVETRYGSQAAEATREALHATGSAVEATQNIRHLGPKTIVKNAAKETSVQFVKGYAKGSAGQSGTRAGPSGASNGNSA